MNKKKFLVIPASTIVVITTLGSMAYGCVNISGQTKITQLGTSGGLNCNGYSDPPATGCSIDVSSSLEVVAEASGVQPNTAFYLTFLNKAVDRHMSGTCTANSLNAKHPHVQMKDGSGNTPAVVSDASGNIASSTRYLPTRMRHGLLWPEEDLDIVAHGPHNGTASICWHNESAYRAAHDTTVLITGGSA